MSQQVFADPERGFPGKWRESDGTPAEGTYQFIAYVYGSDEVPHADAETLAELRAKYWDETQGALVIPFTAGRNFTFGPKLLAHSTDATMVSLHITFRYPDAGPPPEVCSCGRPSVRHAVQFHLSETANR